MISLKDQVAEFVAFDKELSKQIIRDRAFLEFCRRLYEPNNFEVEIARWQHSRLAPLNNLWLEVIECLEQKKFHEYDCADQDEEFGPNETCDCGAIMVKQTLAKIKEAVEKNK